MRVDVVLDWKGPQWKAQYREAVKGMLMDVARAIIDAAREIVHVITGALRASIRAWLPGNPPYFTSQQASLDSDTNRIPEPEASRDGQALELGATMWYALEEEQRHPYLGPSVNAGRTEFARIVEDHKF